MVAAASLNKVLATVDVQVNVFPAPVTVKGLISLAQEAKFAGNVGVGPGFISKVVAVLQFGLVEQAA
jgi:hypothetical protein